jgi:hypothetical protein
MPAGMAMRITPRHLLALLFVASFPTALHAQTIEIKLVNGRNGRPISGGSCLHIAAGVRGLPMPAIATDGDGVARIRFTDKDSEENIFKVDACKGEWTLWGRLRAPGMITPVFKYADSIWINTTPGHRFGNNHYGYIPCWVDANKNKYSWLSTTDFSTRDVLEHGVVTVNTCGKTTASPQPGQLILFVRLPTNWEAWRQAWN